jgi:hypothetical protein
LVERGKADRSDQQKALENSESDPCRGFILKIEGFLSITKYDGVADHRVFIAGLFRSWRVESIREAIKPVI